MSRGAQNTPSISHPPSQDVVWQALRFAKPGRGVGADLVTARTWFEARAKALVALQCEPWELAPLRPDPSLSAVLAPILSATFE